MDTIEHKLLVAQWLNHQLSRGRYVFKNYDLFIFLFCHDFVRVPFIITGSLGLFRLHVPDTCNGRHFLHWFLYFLGPNWNQTLRKPLRMGNKIILLLRGKSRLSKPQHAIPSGKLHVPGTSSDLQCGKERVCILCVIGSVRLIDCNLISNNISCISFPPSHIL